MVFSDISLEALRHIYTNFHLNSGKLPNIRKIDLIQSDIFSKIQGKFDVITVNFPQTPCKDPIKSDRWGKETGGYFNNEFIRNIKTFIHENSEIFMLF